MASAEAEVRPEARKEWLNAEEKTDDELAAEEVNGDVVVDVAARPRCGSSPAFPACALRFL